MPTLLAIDDEPGILDLYRLAFQPPAYTVVTADSGFLGIRLFTEHRPDAVLLDVKLPDLTGLEVFRRLCETDRQVPVIFVTGESTTGTAIEAMARGAFEYLLKPIQVRTLTATIEEALRVRQLMQVPAHLPGDKPVDDGSDLLIGRCPAMQEVCKAVGRIAAQDAPALILGESGTGKELVARAIYQYSARCHDPFLTVNCAAIPEALFESELFGHEKGAFTGADRRRIGKFEQCSSGTLFLDEIGETPIATQSKLLRVLQDQTFERVGGEETVRTHVRLIAATNRDLESMCQAGQFRSDLYYRLNVFSIRLPPLRERREDLPELATHFLRRFSQSMRRDVVHIDPAVMDILRAYHWPGNIRELQSCLRQALLNASGSHLLPEFLPDVLTKAKLPSASAAGDGGLEALIDHHLRAGTHNLYAEWLAVAERDLFERVLQHTQGNLSQAARILGIHRNTLRTRLQALDVRWQAPAADTQ